MERCRSLRHIVRKQVYASKNKLKGSGIPITGSFIKIRTQVLKRKRQVSDEAMDGFNTCFLTLIKNRSILISLTIGHFSNGKEILVRVIFYFFFRKIGSNSFSTCISFFLLFTDNAPLIFCYYKKSNFY